jgi:tryptophan halogenase
MAGSPLADIAYAFHFDAARYAALLRRKAEAAGVQRVEGRIDRVETGGAGIQRLHLQGGAVVEGDFFIDCSGLHALLLGEALGVPFEDWRHWLPCDRAWAVPTAPHGPLRPFTRATAREAGWQWRIPLQHRAGNGHVFASGYIDEAAARETLLRHLDGPPLAEPRLIRFRTGRRARAWVGNCVAIGLSGGFLEPLESTSLHLIQSGVLRLLDLFPAEGLAAADIAEYNRQTADEMAAVRDFIILHYTLTRRSDTPFWQHCRTMAVPASLRDRIELFASHGRLFRHGSELFSEPSWLQVLLGQGPRPRAHHPLAERRPLDQALAFVDDTREVVRRCVAVMPDHAEFISAHCAAPAA